MTKEEKLKEIKRVLENSSDLFDKMMIVGEICGNKAIYGICYKPWLDNERKLSEVDAQLTEMGAN